MNEYRQYRPSALLANFIECYWTFRSTGDTLRDERLIPGGRVEMIFNFASPFHWLIHEDAPLGDLIREVHFMGQRDRIFFGRAAGQTDMLGVRFKSGGLTAFTRVPVTRLLNKMIPAEELLGQKIRQWETQLSDTAGDADRIRLLEHHLLNSIRDLPADQPLLNTALHTIRNSLDEIAIHTVADQLGWSYKKLERAFLRSVGYTPKSYHKLIRFNTAIRKMETRKTESLTGIGYECGYYDQAHFIKDFRRYTGTTPGHFQLEEHTIAEFLIHQQTV